MPPAAEPDPDLTRRLQAFVDLLLHWNATLNLVAARDGRAIWQRHVMDSFQLVAHVPPGTSRGIDLGSGAGFPGLIVAMATGIPFDLVESDRRKSAFLRSAAQATGTPVTVHACRIEAADLPPAPLITARALAPLPKLLGYAARFVAPGGVCLFLKGAAVDAELAAAEAEWDMHVTRIPSTTASDGTLVRISDLRPRGAGG